MGQIKHIVIAGLFGLAVAVVVYTASQTIMYRPFLQYQNMIDDSHFLRRFLIAGDPKGVTDNIVIVDIDDKSIEALRTFTWWPRWYFAETIHNLNRDGARLIFLDAILVGRYRGNSELADTLRTAGNVIGGYYFNLNRRNQRRRPIDTILNERFAQNWFDQPDFLENEFIRAQEIVHPYHDFVMSTSAIGFTNYIPDYDGVLRHIPLYILYGGMPMPSVSLQMWMHLNNYTNTDAAISPYGVQFGALHIPTDRRSFMRLNYISSGSVFTYVSFLDVFKGTVEPGTFQDKIVMIGSSAESLRDLKKIPGYAALPGVEVHATALANLMSNDFLTVMPGNIVFLVTMITGVLASLVFMLFPSFQVGLPVAIVAPLLFYVVSIYGFISRSILMNVTIPSATIIMLYVVITIHRIVESYELRTKNVSDIGGDDLVNPAKDQQ